MVKVTPLGGVAEVTNNLFVYETEQEALLVDCGAGFPEEEEGENKILIPDFAYLQTIRKKLRGLIITHAHFDHYGAIPYLLEQFDLPIFGSRISLEFLKAKMIDLKIKKGKKLQQLSFRKKVSLGNWQITPFLVNHSVPDAFGLVILTPAGKIFHVSDFKFDLTPVDNRIFDFQSCIQLAQSGVLALFSDCLGACEEGFTQTEKKVGQTLFSLMAKAPGQLLMTTLSSNIHRLWLMVEAARVLGRQIVPVGRSIETSLVIGERLGYLPRLSRKKQKDSRRLVYLVAGSYGQENSNLMRVAQGKHPGLKLEKGATVIFSADPSPPNTEAKVNKLVDLLTLQGARVHYYEIQENLHASGHGSAGDLQLLMALVKPKFFVPIGGCPRHMRAYAALAKEMGIGSERVFELLPGESLIFGFHDVRRGPVIKLKKQMILV